jgi:hypothetical protein
MGGNTVSSPRSLTCENVADLVDSLGASYTIYRPVIFKYGVDGGVLVEYSSVEDAELNSLFIELEVTSGLHRIKFKNCIRAFAEKKQIADSSRDTPATSKAPVDIPAVEAVSDMKLLEKSIPKVITPLKLPDGKYHVFLTHDWGDKGSNHRRVSKLNRILKEKYGLTTWFDEDRMDGDVRTTMTEGVENSLVMIIFITQRYQTKVIEGGSDNRDNCKVRILLRISRFTLKFLSLFCVFFFVRSGVPFPFLFCSLSLNMV